jgi:hypothetical protein
MAYTTTINTTFTKTHAEHIASKIAADLHQLQRLYGYPSEKQINDYVVELVNFLADGYLKSVDYGFRKNGSWILAVSYEINETTGTLRDDNSGRIPVGKDITGATFGSYLRNSSRYEDLSSTEKDKVLTTIPIKRQGGDDPLSGLIGNHDKTYASGGVDAIRKIITTN